MKMLEYTSLTKAVVEEEVGAKKKKRGAGGAWRAFVHVNSKGVQLSPQQSAELRAQYHSLSPADKQYYIDLGSAATLAKQAGGSTFPAYSRTAAQARGLAAPHPPRSRRRAQLDETIHHHISEHRQQRKLQHEQEQQVQQALYQHTQVSTEPAITRRHQLQNDKVQWTSVPHTCEALHCQVCPSQWPPGSIEGFDTVSELQQAWSDRHLGVRHIDASTLPPPPPQRAQQLHQKQQQRRCFLAGRCLCTGPGRVLSAFWSRITSSLKSLLIEHMHDLVDAQLILQWYYSGELRRKRATRKSSQEQHIPVEEVIAYTHIPLHYKKPWRPTFLVLNHLGQVKNETNEVFIFEPVIRNNVLELKNVYQFAETLQKDRHVSVSVLRLTDTFTAGDATNRMYAEFLPHMQQEVWDPSRKQRQRQRVHEDLDNILPTEDAPPPTFPSSAAGSSGGGASSTTHVTPLQEEGDDDDDDDVFSDIDVPDMESLGDDDSDVILHWSDPEATPPHVEATFQASITEGDVTGEAQPSQANQATTRSSSQSSTSSSTSSSSSSTSTKRPGTISQTRADEPAAIPVEATSSNVSPEAALQPQVQALTKFYVGGEHKDVFAITPKQPGGSGGKYGGFQGDCPFHSKSSSTGCKKWSAIQGPSAQHRRDALVRIHCWLLRHSEVDLQREHVAMPLRRDVSEVNLRELQELLQAEVRPSGKSISDWDKDISAGRDPNLAPRRVSSKRS